LVKAVGQGADDGQGAGQISSDSSSMVGMYDIEPRSAIVHADSDSTGETGKGKHLDYYHAFGRLMGKAVYERHTLNAPLVSYIFYHLLGRSPTMQQVPYPPLITPPLITTLDASPRLTLDPFTNHFPTSSTNWMLSTPRHCSGPSRTTSRTSFTKHSL
jgi:hypothetical protein